MFVDGTDKGKERIERKKNEQETVRKRDRQRERLTDKHSSSSWILTPSLPWCHLKTTNESAKFETLQPFFVLACETIFIKVDVL